MWWSPVGQDPADLFGSKRPDRARIWASTGVIGTFRCDGAPRAPPEDSHPVAPKLPVAPALVQVRALLGGFRSFVRAIPPHVRVWSEPEDRRTRGAPLGQVRSKLVCRPTVLNFRRGQPKFGRPQPRLGRTLSKFGWPWPNFGRGRPNFGSTRPRVGATQPRVGLGPTWRTSGRNDARFGPTQAQRDCAQPSARQGAKP